MKLTDIIKVIFLALAILSSSSCEKEESRTSDPTREVTITLDVDRLSLESASIRVRHDGESDILWVYEMTEDLTSDADQLIDEKLAKELELTGEIVVYTGRNRSITVSDLAPKAYYRFICKSIDPVTGSACGEAAEIQFRTRRDPSVFDVNDNWSVERGERSVNYVDKMEYDNFICKSSDEETYVLLPIKVSDFMYYYNNEIRALFEDFHASYGLSEGDSQWKEIVKSGDQTLKEQRLRSGEWVVFMVGIDVDGELSGLYQRLDMTIEPEVPTKEYERWLGQWTVSNSDGIELFDIYILPSENNLWYYLAGWEGDNLYFDTYDQTLMIETFFNKSTGRMEFISQYVNTMITDYETIDFYFSGTFYYGGNYVVDAMNYKMAETFFTNSEYTQARVEGLTFTGSGLTVPIQEICYFYYSGPQPSAISLDIPNLPLTFRKVQ